MDWLHFLLAVAILVGVAAGTALVIRNPVNLAGLVKVIVAAAMPEIIRVVSRRMTPEEERALQDCQRQAGRKWNHLKKRCE